MRISDWSSDVCSSDLALFGLHGAMVADGYDDCEGDLLRRAREIVGPDTVIGAEPDPHCHLTATMTQAADFLVCFKEYPHTDILDRKSVVWGNSVSVAVDLGGRRIIKKKKLPIH